MKVFRHLSFLVLFTLSLGLAQETALEAFLAPLQEQPSVLAAEAGMRAAEAQLSAVYSPVNLEASGGFTLFNIDESVDIAPEVPGDQSLPGSGGQVALELAFRPFPFGDIADLVDQQRLGLREAQLSYLDALSKLEVQALETAANVQLAREGVALAQQGLLLAQTALEATQIRFEKGAANARELREAEQGLAEAALTLTNAEARLALAERSLSSLVGPLEPPELASLMLEPPTDGVPLSLARAQLGLERARISRRSNERSLYPVLQAGYDWNLDDQNTLGVSIETRTLQPRLSYSFQDPGASPPQDTIEGRFQVGVSANLSPGVFEALKAVRAQVAAAQAALDAAQSGARTQLDALEVARAQAERELELAQLSFDNAQLSLEESQAREALGLSIPLSTQQDALELTRAGLELLQARQALLSQTYDLYEFYALPISEVQP